MPSSKTLFGLPKNTDLWTTESCSVSGNLFAHRHFQAQNKGQVSALHFWPPRNSFSSLPQSHKSHGKSIGSMILAHLHACPMVSKWVNGGKVGRRKGELFSGFCCDNVVTFERNESDIDSTGAELWSLRDWPLQSSKFRWIKFHEQDSSEWSNSYSDGIPESFKSYGQRQHKDE